MGTEAATTRPEVEPDRQTLLFFWTLGLSMLVALLGLLFDGVWHSLRQFEEFWSPPHLMIYTGFGVGGASLLIALLTPRLRENPALGPGFKVPPLAVPVPASLFLIGLGSIQAVAAGFVDSAWHAQLGINETTWAYPHMMVVLGGVLMSMGLMTGFSGLRVPRGRPAWPVVMFCAGLLIIFAFPLAPLAQTPEAIQRQIANADFYRLDAQNIRVQHAFLQQGIHAGHPLLVPLLWPLALMAPFAIARSLAPGHKLVATRGALACAILLTGAFLLFARLTPTQPGAPQAVAARDTTLLIGFFILALPLDLLPRRKGAAVAGLLFAAGHGLRFGFHPLAFLLAPLGALAGEATGEAIGRYVKEPTPRHTALAMGLLTFALPPMFGMIDIYLRLWF